MSLTIREIDERVEGIDPHLRYESIFELLGAYGIPKSTITRLQKDSGGTLNKGRHENELVWKDKVFYSFASGAKKDDLLELISEIEGVVALQKVTPRFLIVASDGLLLAKDTKTGDSLDIVSSELKNQSSFFAPWAKIERAQIENTNPADVKAAAKMAKLYDEIVKKNDVHTSEEVHALNAFFARLLFCFFAEDTGVFGEPKEHLFSNTVVSRSQNDGSDFAEVLDDLFVVLDTPTDQRVGVPPHFAKFGYVNGSLFSERTPTPTFTAKSRAILMECAELDWSQINPDIFGSMIQAVVHPSQRSGLGMHYTSVENIMKVLRPLFLDELEAAFTTSENDVTKLTKLLDRIAAIKVFDPACGSGNFLIIAYKELRHLEHQILQRIHELSDGSLGASMAQTLFPDPRVKLENFYGIEIDDFACEIATLSLWLTKHQMNREFAHMFDKNLSLIPLVDHGNIVEGNATRIKWDDVCELEDGRETYVCGNPPYLGARLQSAQQKADLLGVVHGDRANNLDYICAWLIRGADYVSRGGATAGLVTTNSVFQGDQVGILWPLILNKGVELAFAVESFRWSNNAARNAGVTCVVVGLAAGPVRRPIIYNESSRREVKSISPYLVEGPTDLWVNRESRPIAGLPALTFGSMPNDGGHLLLSVSECEKLVKHSPDAAQFLKRYMGSREFLNGQARWAIWVSDQEIGEAENIESIAERVERVREYREQSARAATRKLAGVPYRFGEVRHKETPAIIVPRVSSERREYIPMGFLGPDTVISDAANAIYDAQPWVFGLIQSRMHMVWVRAVAGRLEDRYRYSAVLCYNTFPVPPLTDKHSAELTHGTSGILSTRQKYSGRTLAELYDPEKMPDDLRTAHKALDEIVDKIYQPRRPFASDEARLERLFMMYAKATGKATEETLEQLALLDD